MGPMNPEKFFSLSNIDVENSGVRKFASKQFGMKHPGKFHVLGIFGRPQNLVHGLGFR